MSNDHDHTIKTITIMVVALPKRSQNDQKLIVLIVTVVTIKTTIKTISTTKNVSQDRLAPLPAIMIVGRLTSLYRTRS
jgi:hypothetical protein